jgi:hypothetical protein
VVDGRPDTRGKLIREGSYLDAVHS